MGNRSRDTETGVVPPFQKRGKYLLPSQLSLLLAELSVVMHVVEASLPANGSSGRYSSATADARLDKNCHNFDSNSTPDAFVALE